MPHINHRRGETRTFVFHRDGPHSRYPHLDIWTNRYSKVRFLSKGTFGVKTSTTRFERRVTKKKTIAEEIDFLGG